MHQGPTLASRQRVALLVALALWMGAAAVASAQNPAQDQAASQEQTQDPVVVGPETERDASDGVAGANGRGPRVAAEVEAFFDGLMAAWMEANHIAGATVAVVRDGEPLLAKGYGFANVEARVPVSAETTLFRIGSISKLFVWTAVMQLVEQGSLELDEDVNNYLESVQVPATFPEPVTLSHLMTHTAGFEDQVIGLFGRDEASLAPLSDILARELPMRVRPPGEVASYSNHGTGLAALVVEDATGLRWEDYVEGHILEPLGVTHATFRQPPSSSAGELSTGYQWSGGYVEQPFEFVPLSPVGAASASATAMADFMVMHLQRGRLGEVRILLQQTARTMQRELFRHAPDVNPMAHGFIDMSRNGEWVVGHGGDTLWFHSELALLPDRGVGLFVSTNSAGGGGAASAIFRAFMDQYYPPDVPEEITPPSPAGDRYERIVGTYRANRYSHSSLAKLAALQTVEISVDPTGRLRIGADDDVRWIELSPLTFREEHGDRFLVFRESDVGAITHAFRSDLPIVALERVGPATAPALHGPVLAIVMFLFLWTVVMWPVSAVLRQYYDYRLTEDELLPLAAKGTAWTASLVFVAFAAGMAIVLGDADQIVFGASPRLRALLVLPFVGAGLALVCGGWLVPIFRHGRGSRAARMGYALLVVAFAVALWQLSVWNLLGFRY